MTPPRPSALPRLFIPWVLSSSLFLPSSSFAVPQDDAMTPEEADEGPPGGGVPEPAVEPPAAACTGVDCPSTASDWIFFRYGKDCSGMNWRFLRAVAKAESGLDPRKRAGTLAGLFLLEPETCSRNIGPFTPFLNCSELEDPEANTAAALNRLHRALTGRRDLGGRGGDPAILDACPDNAPADNAVLAYVGLKVGPGVLRHVLEKRACKDGEIRKALASFYDGPRKSRLERGLKKYESGRQAVVGLELAGPLYPAGAVKTALCPAVTGKRLFTREELSKSLADGSFLGKPLFDPETSAQFARGSRLGASWERAVSARLARMSPDWETRAGDTALVVSPMTPTTPMTPMTPGSQLPKDFRIGAKAPPPLDPPAPAGLPSVVDEPVEVAPVGVKLTGPKTVKKFHFNGKTADAEAWTAVYDDGATFAIMAPAGPEPGLHYVTVAQAADAARYLPKASRAVVKTIMINQVVNPDDEYWSKEYKTPNFHSYMTAGAAGIVTVYPDKVEKPLPGENYMRGAMIHETGHTWSYKKWGTATKKGKWLVWKKAGEDDKTWVSEYAKSSISEDIAETFQVYGSAFGSSNFKKHEETVPHRFGMLATELK